jgi:hypothetical protein
MSKLISPKMVETMSNLLTKDLAKILKDSGYDSKGLLSSEFVGIGQSSAFVYSIKFSDAGSGYGECRIYVTRDPGTGLLTADY